VSLYLRSLIHVDVTQCLIKRRDKFTLPFTSIYLSSTLHGPHKRQGWNLSNKFLYSRDLLSIQQTASKYPTTAEWQFVGRHVCGYWNAAFNRVIYTKWRCLAIWRYAVKCSRKRCTMQHRQMVCKFQANNLSLTQVMNFINTIHDMFRHVSGVTKSRYLHYADMLCLKLTECARA
jgi:hypothetical protein